MIFDGGGIEFVAEVAVEDEGEDEEEVRRS